MSTALVVSVRTGRVRELARPAWDQHPERTWRTGYVKAAAAGPVPVGPLGLAGDEQYDHAVHGGPQMAVLAYAEAHYARWRAEPGLEAIGPGGFGENLVLADVDETSVCIGDVWEGGQVTLEVSQPRGPCANISRRWNAPHLLDRVVETARTGWYLRVLRPGSITAGETLRLVARPHEEWRVERVLRLKLRRLSDPDAVRRLATCERLSPEWRAHFLERVTRGEPG